MGLDALLPIATAYYRNRSESDASRAYNDAANPATGAGAYAREAVVGPVSQAMGDVAKVAAPIRGAIGDFVGGVLGDTGKPAPATTLRGSFSAPTVPAPVAPPPVEATNATTMPAVQDPTANAMPAVQAAITAPAPITRTPYIGRQSDPVAGLFATGMATRQLGAANALQNSAFKHQLQASTAAPAVESAQIDLREKRDEEVLRKAASNGDEKALAKLRNIAAAKKGQSPDEALGEKLLDLYMKNLTEYNRDPNNMGKPAPSFQDFLGTLPKDMFPAAGRYSTPMPAGMKRQVGTANGQPVYEDAAGKRFVGGKPAAANDPGVTAKTFGKAAPGSGSTYQDYLDRALTNTGIVGGG